MTSLGIIGVIIMTAGLVSAVFGFNSSAGIILILLGALVITLAILRSYHKSHRENSEEDVQQTHQGLPNYAVVPVTAVNFDAGAMSATNSSSTTYDYVQVPPYTPVPTWTPSGSVEMPYGYPTVPVHYKDNDNPPSYSELFGDKT